MMNINSLRLFVNVVHRLNFAMVAEDTGLSASSVSRAIGALEDDLCTRLFQRTTRCMTLTESGEVFYLYVIKILDQLDQAREQVQTIDKGPSGTLKITASVAFGDVMIIPLLPSFKKIYPDIKLELIFSDQNIDIVSEGIDLAIRHGPKIEADMIVSRLLTTRYRVCASPEYIKNSPIIKTPKDISNHPCILHTLPTFRSMWTFRDTERNHKKSETNVTISGDIAVASAISLRSAVLRGLGPGLMADWLIKDDLETGRLIDLFPEYDVMATDFDTAVWTLYSSRTYLPQKVRVMIDFLRSNLSR